MIAGISARIRDRNRDLVEDVRVVGKPAVDINGLMDLGEDAVFLPFCVREAEHIGGKRSRAQGETGETEEQNLSHEIIP